MADFIQYLNTGRIGQGILVTIGGMLGVFIVLIIFYTIIKLLTRLFPHRPEV